MLHYLKTISSSTFDQERTETVFKSRETVCSFVICLSSVLLFFVFYRLRLIDDNRLSSWYLVFKHVAVLQVALLVMAGALIAFAVSIFSQKLYFRPWVMFFASFALCAVFWREPEVIIDSSRYFTQAKYLSTFGIKYFVTEWGREIAPWTDLPFMSFIYGAGFKMFGESRLFVQVLNSVLFSLAVVVTSLLERELVARDDSLYLGGPLLLAMPYLYVLTPLMMVDVPSMFFLVLSIYTLHKAFSGGGLLFEGITAVSITCMLLTKYSLWIMTSTLAVMFLYHLFKSPKEAMKRASRVLVMTIVLAAPFAVTHFEVIKTQIGVLVSYQKPALKGWRESSISTFMFQVHPFVTAGALYSLYRVIRKRDKKMLIVFWPILMMLLLGVERARYLVPVFPMIALMASYGMNDLKSARLKTAVACTAIITSFVIASSAYLPYLQKNSHSNLHEAGTFINGLPVERIQVITALQDSAINPSVSVPLLDMYTDKVIDYRYEPGTINGNRNNRISPFRFSWLYENPAFYESGYPGNSGMHEVIVLIHAQEEGRDLLQPEGYELLKSFNSHQGIYTYKTFVNIYQKIRQDI